MNELKETIANVLAEISLLPSDWHGAGSVSGLVLEKIAYYAAETGGIAKSAETGAGKTTLLLSHLSRHHTVFACDFGGSMSQVQRSPIFARDIVRFVEGPTQKTLPQFRFQREFDLVLIDGPHGYPFPDLEYYYFYPHIVTGGLLLVDDIQIPTIRRMFDVIAADDMFSLLEVVDNMAFFRRTEAPTFNPMGDGWWLQGFNRPFYEEMTRPEPQPVIEVNECPKRVVMHFLARNVPPFVKAIVPRSLKRRLLGK